MNKQMFNALKKRLRELPTTNKKGEEIPKKDIMRTVIEKVNSCGTVGCIAVECLIMNTGLKKTKKLLTGPTRYNWVQEAQKLLEIPNGRLFYLSWWPDDLVKKYDAAKTLKDERRVMIQAINRYMKDPINFSYPY